MNELFSFKRFGMLFKKHTVENFKGYSMSVFVLVGILTLVIGWVNYTSNHPMNVKQQYMFFMFFFWAAGTIFTSNVFVNFGDKKKSISILMLPASSLEKFLVGWIYSYVIFQVIFIVIYYSVITTILKLSHWPNQERVEIMEIFSSKDNMSVIVYSTYAFFNAFILFGAIFFKKMHFVKMVFSFFITVIAVLILNTQALKLMINRSISVDPPFNGFSLPIKKNAYFNIDYAHIDLGEISYKWVITTFLLITVLFWCAAYFRLKEKQV